MQEIEEMPAKHTGTGEGESANASEIKAVPETVPDEFEIQGQAGLENDGTTSTEADLPVAATPEVKPVAHILVKDVVDARRQVEEVGRETNPDVSKIKTSQDNLFNFALSKTKNPHPNE